MTAAAAEAYNKTMLRPLLLACVLVIGGGVVAGCGGGVQKNVRAVAKQFLGDGNPQILRVETVHDVGGNRLVIATVHGNFKLQGGCQNPRGCPRRPAPSISYAWLNFSASDPKAMAGVQTTSAAQLAAIDNARNAKSVLGIFPDFTSPAIRCDIPRGSSSGTIEGGCVTLFNTGAIGADAHIKWIKFRERWPFVETRDGHWPRWEKVGGWIVTLDRNERVQSIRVFGDMPPQLRK
jgi:hypothetical protein